MNRTAVTDSAGQAVFNVPAREYKIQANYLNQEYWTDGFVQANSFITIPEGIASVSVSQGSAPLEEVNVYVFTASDTYLGLTSPTDVNGTAAFRLPEGTYKIRADYMNNQYWVTSVITAHEVNGIEIITSGGIFELSVQKDAGEALTGVPVYVFNGSGAYLGITGTTDAGGHVLFDLPDGAYRFRADYMGYQFWTSTSTVPNVLSDVLSIPHTDVTVTVNKVYGFDTAPLENIPVYLFTASGAYMNITANTNSQGQVAFNLPLSDYKVRADFLSTQTWSEVFNATGATININHGFARVHVFRTSVDIYDAPVYIFTEAGGYLGRVERTDATGLVSFMVPEGAYKFRVDYDGNQTWSDVINILAHEETAVEMDLDILMSDLTRSPHPVRFDGVPPIYAPEKTMVASLSSVQGLLAQVANEQVSLDKLYFYLNDHLGAPRIVVDDAGAVVWQADYEPFGKAAVGVGSSVTNQFRFAGQYYDEETGLHYNYHRYYDPKTGRYLTPDPIGLLGGINPFIYAYANPTNLIDPLGLMAPGSEDMWTLIGEDQSSYYAAEASALNDFSNFSAGLGDALLLGLGDNLRDALGMEGIVDECSKEYKYGAWSSFAAGITRVGYAAIAKAGSVLATSGAAASAFRESLKNVFRLGIGKNWRKFNVPKNISDAAFESQSWSN